MAVLLCAVLQWCRVQCCSGQYVVGSVAGSSRQCCSVLVLQVVVLQCCPVAVTRYCCVRCGSVAVVHWCSTQWAMGSVAINNLHKFLVACYFFLHQVI